MVRKTIAFMFCSICLLAYCRTIQNEDERSLSIAEDRFRFQYPAAFKLASDIEKEEYYSSERKPDYLLIANTNTRISITHDRGRLDAARMQNMSNFIAASITNTDDQVKELKQNFLDLKSGKWGQITYTKDKSGTDKKVFRSIYFIGLTGKPLFITLTCKPDEAEKWMAVMTESLSESTFN